CCARAASGHAATPPPITLMKSRRLMAAPRLRTGSVQTSTLEGFEVGLPDVRFGSKADIPQCNRHVRFTPESGHLQCTRSCLLWANSGHRVWSFDHLVGAGEKH